MNVLIIHFFSSHFCELWNSLQSLLICTAYTFSFPKILPTYFLSLEQHLHMIVILRLIYAATHKIQMMYLTGLANRVLPAQVILDQHLITPKEQVCIQNKLLTQISTLTHEDKTITVHPKLDPWTFIFVN